jgi:ABC-2 type transport system permease protein
MATASNSIFRDIRTFLVLLGRELSSYFYSPIGYVTMCFFLVAIGFNFYSGISAANQGPQEITVVEISFNTVLFWIPMLLLFPLLTMRTYADEFRMGTFESLTTAPVRDWQVVLSKFFGAFFFYCILWLPSVLYFVGFEYITGKPAAVSPGAYIGAYSMLLLIGMFYISIGCLASSLCTEQITAAIIAFAVVFGFFILGLIGVIRQITDPELLRLVEYFSPVQHMSEFTRGIIDTKPIVWNLSMTILMLTINFQVFQYRKWKA